MISRNRYLLAQSLFRQAERKNDFWGMLITIAVMQSSLGFLKETLS
jgi:hypothetical protein